MLKTIATTIFCFIAAAEAAGGTVVVAPLSAAEYADTEVATNVAFNVGRSDTKIFEVRMEFSGTVSNNVQIAFGRDLDSDGDLAPEESDLVLGWRRGRYFVEDVSESRRAFAASAETADGRFLTMRVATDEAFRPKTVSFRTESGACFDEVGVPDYLFSTNWNLAKVTRRGVDATAEWCRIDNAYRRFVIQFR